MLSTCFWLSTWATVTISTIFELSSSHARASPIKFTKQEWVSQSVRESVTDKHNQWSDSGPIKIPKMANQQTIKIIEVETSRPTAPLVSYNCQSPSSSWSSGTIHCLLCIAARPGTCCKTALPEHSFPHWLKQQSYSEGGSLTEHSPNQSEETRSDGWAVKYSWIRIGLSISVRSV